MPCSARGCWCQCGCCPSEHRPVDTAGRAVGCAGGAAGHSAGRACAAPAASACACGAWRYHAGSECHPQTLRQPACSSNSSSDSGSSIVLKSADTMSYHTLPALFRVSFYLSHSLAASIGMAWRVCIMNFMFYFLFVRNVTYI